MQPRTYRSHSPLWHKRQNLTAATLSTLSFIGIMLWRNQGWDYVQLGFLFLLLSWLVFVWVSWFNYRAKNHITQIIPLLNIVFSLFRNIKDNHFFLDLFIILPCFMMLGFISHKTGGVLVGFILGSINLVLTVIAEKYPLSNLG
jgi:hypothetical protein